MLDNKEKLLFGSKAGFFVVGILGCINHFVYAFSGNDPIIGAFAPINESTWEHLKLLFFPYILYTIFEYIIYGRHIDGFLFSRVTGLLVGLVFIPAAFYTYTGIFGGNHFIVDILLFFIADALAFCISTKRILRNEDTGTARAASAVIIILCLTVLFVGFTFYPPQAPLFVSPV